MTTSKENNQLFFIVIIVFKILYIALAINRPFISDELHEAVTVESLKTITPYLDKLFYKNVLGYYLKLPFHFISNDWWNTLIITRIFLAFFFTSTISWFCYKLKDHFSIKAIVAGLICFAFFTQNLTHATSYRVDMLTAMFGLISFFYLKQKKYIISGIIAGLSFYISQKGVFYCLAGLISIIYVYQDFSKLKNYIFGILGVTFSYILFWGSISNIKIVLYSIFIKDTVMATNLGYNIRHYWASTFFSNIFFWIFILFSLAYLYKRQRNNFEKLFFSYITSLLVFALLMGQPWPYFFILFTPFLMINLIDFFERQLQEKPRYVFYTLIALCSLYSSLHFLRKHSFSNQYQNFHLSNFIKFLDPNDHYIAGFNLHNRFTQSHEMFDWLHAPNRKKIRSKSNHEIEEIIKSLEADPAKILISNYRTKELGDISKYLYSNYLHFWGNIFVYSPQIEKKQSTLEIHFKGRYLILCEDKNKKILINDILHPCEKLVSLEKGEKRVSTKTKAQLKLMLTNDKKLLRSDQFKERSLNFTYDL